MAYLIEHKTLGTLTICWGTTPFLSKTKRNTTRPQGYAPYLLPSMKLARSDLKSFMYYENKSRVAQGKEVLKRKDFSIIKWWI